MTTLICWIAHDQEKPSSVYLASDSRLSWSDTEYWDKGRKIFFSNKYPDILGYCGDVLFCSQVISQIMSYVDECNIFDGIHNAKDKIEIIKNVIFDALLDYPINYSNGIFEINYVTRENKYDFKIYVLKWDKRTGWEDSEIPIQRYIDKRESLLLMKGTGGIKYRSFYNDHYKDSDLGGYSRSYFMCLDDFLEKNEDVRSGGVIQIAALYNSKTAQAYGVIKNNKRYIYGLEVERVNRNNNLRWVNEKFENCDITTMQRQEKAQLQPKINLGKKSQIKRRNFLPR